MSSADDVRERAALLRLLWPKEDNMDVFERAAEALWQAGRPVLGEELARAAAELRSAVSEELAWDLGGIGAKRLEEAKADLARAREALTEIVDRNLRPCGIFDAPLPNDVALAEVFAIARAALAAGSGEVSPAEAARALDEGTKRTRLDRAAGSGEKGGET